MRVGRSLLVICTVLLFAAMVRRDAASVAPVRLLAVEVAELQTPDSQAADSQQQNKQAYSLPKDKLAKAIALDRIRNVLNFAYPLWGLGVLWLLLASGAAVWLDAWSRRVSDRPAIHGLLFFTVLIVVVTVADLPLDWYGHRVSLAYGISVQGWGSWLMDHAKALGLALLLSAPLMLLVHWIVRRSPRHFWFWAWLVALPVGLFITFAEPLGERIFNQFEPLSKNNPALVAELAKVVTRTGTSIPPDRMFLMKASAKTTGLNAYVTGLGTTKRIVVWDTTIGRVPDDEILYIFAHESGHYVLNHIVKGLLVGAIGIFFVFWACARAAGWLVQRFGARWRIESLGSAAGFVVLLLTVNFASFAGTPIGNLVSRHIEHEADVYGQEAVHGIVADPQKTAVSTMNHLGEAWLEDPNPNAFIEFWSYSHPSTQHRAEFAAGYDPWANGGRGKFFDH